MDLDRELDDMELDIDFELGMLGNEESALCPIEL